jgi:tRNA (guanine37-N1)-methyltransferase
LAVVVRFDIVTIFPEMVSCLFSSGILGRASSRGLIDVRVVDLRGFTNDRHRTVDDIPFGGGPGMVLKPEPLFRAIDAIREEAGEPGSIILTSPEGLLFRQADAIRLSRLAHLVVLCGRYEGVDERVRDHLATETLSIGDYVVTGGELPAAVMLDAVTRLLPGAVGDADSVEGDSFMRGLLDFPQYTRPAEFRRLEVPPVLLSGHHAEIRRWRKREAIRRTLQLRPEMLQGAQLDEEERQILRELVEEREKGACHGHDGDGGAGPDHRQSASQDR